MPERHVATERWDEPRQVQIRPGRDTRQQGRVESTNVSADRPILRLMSVMVSERVVRMAKILDCGVVAIRCVTVGALPNTISA